MSKKVQMISEFERKKDRKKRKRKHNRTDEHGEKRVKFENDQEVNEIETPNLERIEASDAGEIVEDVKLEVEHNQPPSNAHKNKNHQKHQNNNKNDKTPKPQFRYKKNTIYEDLLKPQKDAELSVILQCFRYIVKQKLIK